MLELETVFAPFRSILGNYNYWITTTLPTDQAQIIPATTYLDHTFLLETIRERARRLGTTDLKVATSDWQLYYNRAVLPLVMLAMTLGGVGLDANINNLSLILEEDKPHSVLISNLETAIFHHSRCQTSALASKELQEVCTTGELHQLVFTSLFRRNFSPLFEALYRVTHLSKKILWGNLGYSCFSLYNFLNQVLDDQKACQEDSGALLEQRYNPRIDEGENPLYQPIYYESLCDAGLPNLIQVRRTCCLFYRLPNYGKCSNCPLLKPSERYARWKAMPNK